MKAAASGPASDGNIYGRVMNRILGTKLDIIPGYQGSSDTLLAIERGEVEGTASVSYASVATAKKDWFMDGKINILVQNALKGHPDLAGVPTILEFAKSDEDRKVLELVFARQSIGYPYAAPPDVPPDRLLAIRKAFAEVVANPDFVQECNAAGVLVDPVSGDEIEHILTRIYSSPAAIIERARAAMSPD